MALTKRQVGKLNRILDIVQDILRKDENAATSAKKATRPSGVRRRRSAKEAEKMRSDILKQRARGVSAAELADKYDVSTAYIYMIKK
jgi:Mor family transcriptional regulator